MNKNNLIKVIHTGKSKLKMDDAAYRAMLERHGAGQNASGEYSTTTMTEKQLQQVLDEMRQKGFTNAAGRRVNGGRKPKMIAKVKVMWRILGEHGAVRHADEQALQNWFKTVTGVERLEWGTVPQLNQMIQSLKAVAVRNNVDEVW